MIGAVILIIILTVIIWKCCIAKKEGTHSVKTDEEKKALFEETEKQPEGYAINTKDSFADQTYAPPSYGSAL